MSKILPLFLSFPGRGVSFSGPKSKANRRQNSRERRREKVAWLDFFHSPSTLSFPRGYKFLVGVPNRPFSPSKWKKLRVVETYDVLLPVPERKKTFKSLSYLSLESRDCVWDPECAGHRGTFVKHNLRLARISAPLDQGTAQHRVQQ